MIAGDTVFFAEFFIEFAYCVAKFGGFFGMALGGFMASLAALSPLDEAFIEAESPRGRAYWEGARLANLKRSGRAKTYSALVGKE